MKSKLLLLVALFLLGKVSVAAAETSPTTAPQFNFERAYQDYLYTLEQYKQANVEYVASKQTYLTYNTLTAQTEAQSKTLAVLQSRDEVMRTYLTVLRTRLAEATGVTNYEQNVLYLKLDGEVVWYQNHYKEMTSAGSLEDLFSTGREFDAKIANNELLAYRTLGAIALGKENKIRQQMKDQITATKEKIVKLRAEGKINTDKTERWMLEAENKITRSEEKQALFEKNMQTLTGQVGVTQRYYANQSILEESNQYLKEASTYLKELLKDLSADD